MRDAGKIREIGICNVDVDQLARAMTCAPIVSVQERYDVLNRANEAVLDACSRVGVVFLPWFPPTAVDTVPAGSALEQIAERHRAWAHQVALSWLLARSPWTLPLPGTAEPARYESDLTALSLTLGDDEITQLSAAPSR